MRFAPLELLVLTLALPMQTLSAQVKDATPSSASRQLYTLEDQWAAALVKGDASFFRRTLHRDYVYSDERGTFNKEQVIAEQVGGTDTVEYAANQDMKAHVHGSVALVTGILIVRGRGKDGRFQHRYRYTDTWLRDDGRWLMIGSQDYLMPAQ